MKKLHLGCGLNTPPDWINLDGSWNARLARRPLLRGLLKGLGLIPAEAGEVKWSREIVIHDVRKPLPFADGSIDAVYSAHLLEHLYLEEADRLLGECHRVLIPGGILRVVVPDLRSLVFEYTGKEPPGKLNVKIADKNPGDRLNLRLFMHPENPPRSGLLHRLYQAMTGFHTHKWMYDADSLALHFKLAGFGEIREMGRHQSRIAAIESVETSLLVPDGPGICLEGKKAGPG